jgi:hypothetical protein
MAALKPELRKDLERVIIKARNRVVADVTDRLKELNVHEGKRGALSEAQAKLRIRLRAHGKQIGDVRNSQSEAQQIDRLVQECAYEQWHRMIFVRFLAENDFLIDPEYGQAVPMESLIEIAEESKVNPWVLGGQFASAALPAIFRKDDPLLEVRLSTETQRELNDLLGSLPLEVFRADDSLGWVYQFWQSEEKDRVNASGDKIDGRSIPAVTQLFTEHYMVLFLLHNTLGAWHAGKVLAQNPSLALNSKDEAELRRAVALETAGRYEFEYLRFVREGKVDEDTEPGPWRPMGGTYDDWPKTAAELKVLDPSCGSGHFLVAAFELLVRLRMHEEELSIDTAVEAVLRDNLFGLEIDPRCTQIAAFNVAMAVWKLTDPKPLPPMRNIACSGIPLGSTRDEWMKSLKVALPNSDLGFQWGQLYDMFSKADTLGSLINPQRFFRSGLMTDLQLAQMSQALSTIIADDRNATDEQHELAAAAQGLTRATELLCQQYSLVATNVPYRQSDDFPDHVRTFFTENYEDAKADLATVFYSRIDEFLHLGGASAVVLPQGALYKDYYSRFRRRIFGNRRVPLLARLGAGAFNEITGEEVKVCLINAIKAQPDDGQLVHQLLATDEPISLKPECLRLGDAIVLPQERILVSEKSIVSVGDSMRTNLLESYANFSNGIQTGDFPRFGRNFWELRAVSNGWKLQLSTVKSSVPYGGREGCLLWEDGRGALHRYISEKVGKDRVASWIRGLDCAGSTGVAISAMGTLKATLYQGELFDDNTVVIIPKRNNNLVALWNFCRKETYNEAVRKIDQSQKVRGALLRVPFERHHDPTDVNAIPDPESNDPTQWLFHGRPEYSTAPLQVAVARLLGYRWPAELDAEMHLSQQARDLIARCSDLDEFIDDDGIVCIPSVRGEDPARDRLLRFLHAAGVNHGENLETWLRDKFFQEHCELFHQRPFIWHVWDGKKDGFAALVNYHKLAGPQGKKLLESLTYSYLGDWITRQEAAVKNNESGADDRLLAAKDLQSKLEAILHGEPPYDIFVRWKPLHEQPIGWTPDINDGVRMNIRPFMLAELSRGRKGAGVLRYPPKIKWTKDRGTEPNRPLEDFPWFWNWDENADEPTDFTGGDTFTGDRWNDLHYTNAFKQQARDLKQASLKEPE